MTAAAGVTSGAGYAWIANADPLTGVPAVVGEIWENGGDDELDAHRRPRGRPLDDLRTLRPELYERCVGLAPTGAAPLHRLVQIVDHVVQVVREEPLALSLDATLRFLHLQHQRGLIGTSDFVRRFPPAGIARRRARLSPHANGHLVPVARGVPCNGEPAAGVLVSDALQDAKDDPIEAPTTKIVLVDRIEAQHTALLHDSGCAGVIAVRGSPADHFAILARESGCGYLALPGCSIETNGLGCSDGVVEFGTNVTVDFVDGCVYRGTGVIDQHSEDPVHIALARALRDLESPVALRVNVDSADDLGAGLPADAQGVGLLRVEHLLRLHDLSDELRCLLEAADRSEPRYAASLEVLGAGLERQLARVLSAVDGAPVTVRLLDFPLHELGGRLATEVNPMLGVRGVRQGVRWPDLYRVQIDALLRAALDLRTGGTPVAALEILVPMVCTAAEVRLVRTWVQRRQQAIPEADTLSVRVGAMLETPAAVVDIEAIGRECALASFGTNDLTQLCLGLSREDYVPIVELHRERDLLVDDPFGRLHPAVLTLIREAAGRVRKTQPQLTLSICGAHASDAQALELALEGLIDHLSVSVADLAMVKLAGLQRSAAKGDDRWLASASRP